MLPYRRRPDPMTTLQPRRSAHEQHLVFRRRVLEHGGPGPTIVNSRSSCVSGNGRGTGPVRAAAHQLSIRRPSSSMKRPPVASSATLVATIGLASASPLPRRDLNIPAATCARESAADSLDQRLSQREQASRVIRWSSLRITSVMEARSTRSSSALRSRSRVWLRCRRASAARRPRRRPQTPLADPLGVGEHRRQHRERQRLGDRPCRLPRVTRRWPPAD